MKRREFLAASLALPALAQPKPHSFTTRGEQFLLDGQPVLIRSGEMHYPRVPRPYWRDRMRKMRAMGLNTLCTYVFWNAHEPQQGKFDFTGNLDVAEYIRTAQVEGLYVILRPGPYICTEWDFGGLPWWLLAADIKVRTVDPRFLRAAALYMNEVGKQLAPLQIHRGGPIVMVQVENEYGSFGKDKAYLGAIRKMIEDAGVEIIRYTADGSSASMLAGGTLPDLPSVINFGGAPQGEFANFARFRQGVPLMCGEYWVGWFDHWGEKHHTGDNAVHLAGIEWMLERNIGFNLYMVHGGTSWGFMNGANFSKVYEPDISSYDYDSPIDEAGRIAPKFALYRDVIRKHLPPGETLPALPAPLPMIEIARFPLKESAPLLSLLGKPVKAERPLKFEELHQDYGFVLYRAAAKKAAKAKLEIQEVRDFAVVMEGARTLGTLDRRKAESTLEVTLEGTRPLDILVENMGRINFGPRLLDDRKGITERVSLGGEELKGWEMYSLPLKEIGGLKFSAKPAPGPAFYRATFELRETGDVYLDMRGWGKGNVWVNGRNLGRYWKVGPQQTLFVPGVWLKKGRNEVIVLDLLEGGTRSLAGVKDPVWSL